MARVKKGLIQVEGKVGEHVIVRNGRYGSYMRKAVAAGSKRGEPALQEQYSRTGYLNQFASDINNLVKAHCGGFKSSRFYEQVQSRLRSEPLNERLLLLYTLRDMEVNAAHPFHRHGVAILRCEGRKDGFAAEVTVKSHPMPGRYRANCYSYEVLFATWLRKEGTVADCERQYSEWVSLKQGLASFRFVFKRPKGAVHWLCGVRIRLGKNEEPIEAFEADGMVLADAGAFDTAEYDRVAALSGSKKKGGTVQKKAEPPLIKRVKAQFAKED